MSPTSFTFHVEGAHFFVGLFALPASPSVEAVCTDGVPVLTLSHQIFIAVCNLTLSLMRYVLQAGGAVGGGGDDGGEIGGGFAGVEGGGGGFMGEAEGGGRG